MTIQEEFTQILEANNIAAIILFLKKLSKKDKKDFVPFLRKTTQSYFELIEEGNTYSRRETKEQRSILTYAGFACLDQKNYQADYWSMDVDMMDKVLEFYVPSWFNKYIVGFKNIETVTESLTYLWLIDKIKRGLVDDDKLLIVRVLCNAIFPRATEDVYAHEYKPGNLEQYEETLKEHFWLIFHYETNIYYTERWHRFLKGIDKDEVTWMKTICKLVKEKKLPRQRVLKESINGTTRNFNRNLINWYMDLFLALEPSQEEILGMQNDLFQAFNSTQSKPINSVLKICKKLVTNDLFDKTSFLQNAPILLTSETKSVVNSTLMILEKMGKKDKSLQDEIALLCCETFIQKEESTQLRAAKLIQQFGNKEDTDLLSALTMYQEEMLFTPKDLLKEFFENEITAASEVIEEEQEGEMESLISNENKIELPETVDDFIFLMSQSLDGNESWHFDFLQASILKFHPQMSIKIIEKLEPTFQKSYRVFRDWGNNRRLGYLDNMAAEFILEYAKILLEKFPNEESLIRVKIEHEKKEAKKKKIWARYEPPAISPADWKMGEKEEIYFPFKYLLMHSLNKILQSDSLPLLSTPTHQPFWIDPEIYVERLFEYQKNDVVPHHADWQIAIARIAPEKLEKATLFAQEKLKGEWLDLTLFIFGGNKIPSKKLKFSNEWKMAVYSKFPKLKIEELKNFQTEFKVVKELLGELDYGVLAEERIGEHFNSSSYSIINGPYIHRELQIEGTNYHRSLGVNENEVIEMPLYDEQNFFLLEYLYLKETPLMERGLDLKRLISFTPNNVQIAVAQVNKQCFMHSEFWDEDSKKTAISMATILLENWRGGGTMAYYFIAATMNCSDKTARGIAAEIWIKGVVQNTMDSKLLGKIIGEMESIEFFPIKRLTDLMMQFMVKISKHHNQALEILIQEIIQRLPEQPIRNTKKVLEIYRELIALNASSVGDEKIKQKLEIWKSNGSLKKIVKELLR